MTYVQGRRTIYGDSDWVYERSDAREIQGPQEFLHTLGGLVNGLTGHGFVLCRVEEVQADSVSMDAEPGSWDHFTAVMPPWLAFWTTYRPDLDLSN